MGADAAVSIFPHPQKGRSATASHNPLAHEFKISSDRLCGVGIINSKLTKVDDSVTIERQPDSTGVKGCLDQRTHLFIFQVMAGAISPVPGAAPPQ